VASTSLSWSQVLAEARTQINAAASQQYLTATNAVVTKNWFWSSPTTVAAANALVAYWLALGARLGYPALLTSARSFYAAASQSTVPDVRVAQIQKVIAQGVGALDAAGGLKDRRLAGIYRGLGEIAKADRIDSAQWRAFEQSGIGIAAGTAKGTAVDVAKIAEKAGRVITDKKPPGTPAWLWFLQRNAWFVAGGALALGIAYVYLRPVLAPLTRVRDAAAAASSRAADKAVARIGTVARNPRRRRQSRR
jgi:hypothetical protein